MKWFWTQAIYFKGEIFKSKEIRIYEWNLINFIGILSNIALSTVRSDYINIIFPRLFN